MTMQFMVRTMALTMLLAGLAGRSPPVYAQLSDAEGWLTPEEMQSAARQSSVIDSAVSILTAPKAARGKGDSDTAGPPQGLSNGLPDALQQLASDSAYSTADFLNRLTGSPAAAAEAVPFDGLESIIGRDERVRVNNTTLTPFRSICRLEVTFPNNKVYTGTAAFVGRRVLLSNAHVVYSKADGGWAKRIRVAPGRDGASEPYGAQFAIDARVPTEWIKKQGNRDFDISWIILPDATLYNRVGYFFGYETNTDARLKTMELNLSGYHGDKNGQQWRAFGGGNQKVSKSQFRHSLDTSKGASGSPVWRFESSTGRRFLVAAHCAGLENQYNIATRMTTNYFKITQDLKAKNP